jgi:hypothetical protein
MTCDRLVCANCAGPVSEGRCAVCRAHRARVHQESGPFAGMTPAVLIGLLLALIAVAVAAQRVDVA